MDLFYRGYDSDARITSGAAHLSAAAARFAVSIVRSVPQLPDAAWVAVQRILTVDAMWSLCLVLAGWLIATIVGGLVGLAVNALLMMYGLIELWKEIKATASTFKQWAVTAYEARTEADLDSAGALFAAALSAGGLTILEVLLTHRIFKAVEGKLRERFPTPDWLKKQYDGAAVQRNRPLNQVVKVAAVIASGVRFKGAKQLASDFPVAAVVVSSAVVTVTAIAVAAWVTNEGSKRRPA